MKLSCCFGSNNLKVSESQNHVNETSCDDLKSLSMVSGAHYIPKKSDWNSVGEGAHFVSADGNVIGVAEGVGNWVNGRVDEGEFARTLMKNCAAAAKSRSSGDTPTPKQIIVEAFGATNLGTGSSTACVVAHHNGALTSANVGQTRFVVFRRGRSGDKTKVVGASEPQKHSFHRSYLLGVGLDPPECAAEMGVAVEEGDVLVVASSGVFHNLYVDEIGDLVSWAGPVPPKVLAEKIAKSAAEKMAKSTDTPFFREAKLAGVSWSGIKNDDITVVIGVIVRV